MSIKLIPMKCPCCGANMNIFDSDKIASPPPLTCAYCNTQFIIDHGELRKYEASDTAVFYADNRIVEIADKFARNERLCFLLKYVRTLE